MLHRMGWERVAVLVILIGNPLALMHLLTQASSSGDTAGSARSCEGWFLLAPPCRLIRDYGGFDESWKTTIGLLAIVTFVAVVVALLDGARRGVGNGSAYVAALVMTAPLVPSVAAVGTVIAYIVRYPTRPLWNAALNDMAVPLGVLFGISTWLLFALVSHRSASADRANMHAYGQLKEISDELYSQFRTVCRPTGVAGQTLDPSAPAPCHEVCRHLSHTRDELRTVGLRWVTGAGYIALWNRVLRADEALLELVPREKVVALGLNDEMRLRGSQIDQRDNLLAKLTRAIEVLGAGGYLTPAPSTAVSVPTGQTSETPEESALAIEIVTATARADVLPEGAERTSLKQRVVALRSALDQVLTTEEARTARLRWAWGVAATEPQARAVLREVRCTVNQYRNDLRDGLVHARNQLIITMIATGITAYVLLGLAVISGAGPRAIVAATAFYLVGALVGLINRLRAQAAEVAGVEDYGLTSARLALTPMLSGLAGVGGVIATAVGAQVLGASLVNPGDSNAGNISATPALLDLDQTFDLTQSAIGIVIAAIFGLSPERLVSRLNNQAEQSKIDLKNSTPPNTGQ